MNNEIYLCAYTYRGYNTQTIVKKAAAYGFDGIEYRDNLSDIDLSNLTAADVSFNRIKKYSKKYNVKSNALFYALPLFGDPIIVKKNINYMKEFIKLASAYGFNILHTQAGRLIKNHEKNISENGSRFATESQFNQTGESLKILGETALANGVTIALETHHNTIHDNTSSLMKLIQMANNEAIKGSLDFGNLYLTPQGENLSKAIQLLKGKTAFTHLKNIILQNKSFDWNIPLQEGDIDYTEVLLELKKYSYSGPLCIEFCGEKTPDSVAGSDIIYLKKIIQKLSGF